MGGCGISARGEEDRTIYGGKRSWEEFDYITYLVHMEALLKEWWAIFNATSRESTEEELEAAMAEYERCELRLEEATLEFTAYATQQRMERKRGTM